MGSQYVYNHILPVIGSEKWVGGSEVVQLENKEFHLRRFQEVNFGRKEGLKKGRTRFWCFTFWRNQIPEELIQIFFAKCEIHLKIQNISFGISWQSSG